MNNFKGTALYGAIMVLFSTALDAVSEMDESVRDTIGFRIIDDIVDLALTERRIHEERTDEEQFSTDYLKELYLLTDMLSRGGYENKSKTIVKALGNVDEEIVRKNIQPKSVFTL